MAAITKWQAGVLNWLDAVSASTRLWRKLSVYVLRVLLSWASGNEPCRVWGNEGHVTWHPSGNVKVTSIACAHVHIKSIKQ